MKRIMPAILSVVVALFPMAVQGFSQEAGNQGLVQMGQGARTMFLLGTVYYASLYVPMELKGKTAAEIIDADQSMSVTLQIDTGMLSRDRFIKAIREGFQKAAKAGFATDQIDRFLGFFNAVDLNKGDSIRLEYSPNQGITAGHAPQNGNLKVLGNVAGLPFKKALFAIWLGPDPVQEGLKKGMLGQKK